MAKAFSKQTGKQYVLYTDGGCAVNPGGPGAYGAVLVDQDTGEFQEFSAGYFASTNNRMEIMGVIAGLKETPEGSFVELYSDSQYVINTLLGRYTKKKNTDLWKKLDQLVGKRIVHPNWVRGHNGNDLNERCDQLATQAMSAPTLIDSGYAAQSADISKVPVKPIADKSKLFGLKEAATRLPQKYFNGQNDDRQISSVCRSAIRTLNKKDQVSFRDLQSLRIGGHDDWSSVKEFQGVVDSDVIDLISELFLSEPDLKSCLRWYCRGLRLDLAARKVICDIEIRENALVANKKKY